MRPAFMTIIRSASVMASTWSCVTNSDVVRRPRCSFWISRRVCARSLASRLESGSSNRYTAGWRTMARPMATRWRWPPDSSRGLARQVRAQLEDPGRLVDALLDLGSSAPWRSSGRRPCCRTRSCAGRARSSGTPWRCRARPARSWLTTRPAIEISPPLISSRPATMRSSVDLPQPDGPTMTTNSPSADLGVDAMDDLVRRGTGAVALDDLA